ncbi:hypothetical protein [Paenibacillus herberti]|uniref:Uncharacterized protein n=1 Tax=Paenibacillus herberti TaxID=1619309 RepID=A0A229P0W9_9BACL|nr:hypothetical protein [Paenibacillus herberti]OXM15790.1 hypothetical protein CGZ75_03465 [Paenibacillus herberti]
MNLGVVLVLFILLVIVTSVFAPKCALNDENPIGISGTLGFDVANYSSTPLSCASVSGDSGFPTPSAYLPAYDGHNHFELTIRSMLQLLSSLPDQKYV